jgi:hypothetical protein
MTFSELRLFPGSRGNPEADSVVPAVGLSVTCHGRTVEAQQVTEIPVSREFHHGNSTGHPLYESVDLTVLATLHGSLDK